MMIRFANRSDRVSIAVRKSRRQTTNRQNNVFAAAHGENRHRMRLERRRLHQRRLAGRFPHIAHTLLHVAEYGNPYIFFSF